jgi:RND family efflux transporter MFP subunit
MANSSYKKGPGRFRRAVIILVLVAGVGTGAYYGISAWRNSSGSTTTTSVQYVTVGYGDIATTLTISGNLSYYDIQSISFGINGTIEDVNVSVGETVEKGTVLATFNDASKRALQMALLEAQSALDAAEAELYDAQHPYSDADIATAAAAVTSAQIALNTAQENLEKAQNPYSEAEIASARAALLNAQIALEEAEDALDKAQHPYTDEEIAAARTAVYEAQVALNNTYTKGQAEIAAAQHEVDLASNDYQQAVLNYGINSTEAAYALTILQGAQANLALVTKEVQDSCEAALEKYQEAQDKLEEMLADPDPDVIQQKEYQLLIAQYNLAAAEEKLEGMLAGPDALNIQQKEEQLVIARNNLAEAEQKLADMQAEPDETEIQIKQIKADNAADALETAQQQAEYNALVAPITGTITAVNISAGNTVSASTTAIEMVDTSVFALTASVSELDIASVSAGQTVSVSIDALSGQTFTGKVVSVASSATTSMGVVSYKVTVTVEDPSESVLKSGMSATADITIQSATHVLIVPNKAIGGTTGNPTLTVLVDGEEQTVAVKTGLSNDSYTEITEGVSEGDQVAVTSTIQRTSTRTPTTTTGEATTIPTVFPGGAITIVPGGTGFPSGDITFTSFPGGGSGGFMPREE